MILVVLSGTITREVVTDGIIRSGSSSSRSTKKLKIIKSAVTPKTAVEKGIGLPENISSLPKKCCVSPNSNTKLFDKIM